MFTKKVSKLLYASLLITGSLLSANQLNDIKQAGLIKIAVPQDFPPFGSVSKDMSIQGYDVDMAKIIAKKLNVKLKLVPVTSANRIPYLKTKKADIIISSLGKNEQREKVIDFTKAYAPFFLGVFGSKDIKVSSPKDLKEQTIGVTRGSVEDLELSKIAKSNVIIKRFEDNNTTISAFISSQIKLIATGNLIISEIANKYPKTAPETKFSLKNSPCYIGLNKNQTKLKEFLNALIEELKTTGELNKISQKWLKIDLPKEL